MWILYAAFSMDASEQGALFFERMNPFDRLV